MNQDQQKEFEQFETLQAKLVRAFFEHPDAQDLGFLVAQALRDVPTLFKLLDDYENQSNEDVLDAIHAVVSNHFALSEANRILTSVAPDV